MKQEFDRAWIIKKSVEVIATYSEGITLRQLYYRLVAQGMENDIQHYKKLVAAMTSARWKGIVDMESFIDRERSMYGRTEAREREVNSEIEEAKENIQSWMTAYSLDRWSNQAHFVEVWIEKKALQGVFESPCSNMNVGLAPCKGYPSLTFLNEAKARFNLANARGQHVIILYFGDYDPSGSDIPISIEKNLNKMGCDLTVERIALNPDLIKKLNLPGVPPKATDSRTRSWDGNEAVELDAVEPNHLKKLCEKAILDYFNEESYNELREKETIERMVYQKELKQFVNDIEE